MMGYGHATMGAAAYLALTSTSALALSVTPQDVPTMATGALLTAGAALLPDIDHHSATIAKTVPSARFLRWTLIASPTEHVARAVERVSGGHRHMTHSLIGIAVATAAAIPLALLHLPASWVTRLLGWVGVHLHPNQVGGGAGTNLGVLMVSVFLAAVASKALELNQVSGGDLMALIMRTWLGLWIIGLPERHVARPAARHHPPRHLHPLRGGQPHHPGSRLAPALEPAGPGGCLPCRQAPT